MGLFMGRDFFDEAFIGISQDFQRRFTGQSWDFHEASPSSLPPHPPPPMSAILSLTHACLCPATSYEYVLLPLALIPPAPSCYAACSLRPLIEELKVVRKKCSEVEAEYQQRKGAHEKVLADFICASPMLKR